MAHELLVFLAGALLIAAVAFFVLRAYRRAGGGASSARPAMAFCGAVALAALGIYLAIGRPELPDAPYRARIEALKQRDPGSYTTDEALAVLGEAARAHPHDALPHYYSGQLLYAADRPQEAMRAYDAALRREPQLAEAMLGLGRSMVRAEGGRVTPEALALFQQAGTLTSDPAPWIYQAMAAMQDERAEDVRRFWGEAYARMARDDPRREMARQMSAGR